MTGRLAISAALSAALLFGASVPLAKALAGSLSPVLLAALLYLGSGVGLCAARVVRDHGFEVPTMSGPQWRRLGAAIALGGVAAPILLMFGLTRTSAAHASLLLNLEAVLTAVLAWIVFGENAGRRVVLGMALIVAGGIVLGWPAGAAQPTGSSLGAPAVAAACLCWALDNNLTRSVSASDAVFIAAAKGLVAGGTNFMLALALGDALPQWRLAASAMGVGLAGYGISLVLFVVALRGLGSARTAAYFSTAPFMGAAVAITAFHEPLSAGFWLAAGLMATGVWLHLTETHDHAHTHLPLVHAHAHTHDSHHRHVHAFPWDGSEPHSHEHRHEAMTHRHPHFPDLHHRHEH